MNPDNPTGQRKRLGGWLVLVMVLGAMLAGLTEASVVFDAVCAGRAVGLDSRRPAVHGYFPRTENPGRYYARGGCRVTCCRQDPWRSHLFETPA